MVRDAKRILLGSVGSLTAQWLLAAQRRRNAGVIALYHRVSPDLDPTNPPLSPADFRAHCEILRSSYDVIPLSEMMGRLGTAKRVAGCAAITFDDGFADFAAHAYPTLVEFGLPATHFLVSDCLTSGKPVWTLRLKHVVARQSSHSGGIKAEVNRLARELGPKPAAERYAWLDAAEADVGIDAPPMLSAADIAAVDSDLIEWGSHSTSHAFLGMQSATDVEGEIAGSKAAIEEVTSQRVRYFSYPNSSYSPEVVRQTALAGYEGAVIVEQREASAGENVFTVPRFDVDRHPPEMLIAETTGLVERLRNIARR